MSSTKRRKIENNVPPALAAEKEDAAPKKRAPKPASPEPSSETSSIAGSEPEAQDEELTKSFKDLVSRLMLPFSNYRYSS